MTSIVDVIPVSATAISGETISSTQASYLGDSSTTLVANSCVIANGFKDIGTIRNITMTGVHILGTGGILSSGSAFLQNGVLTDFSFGTGTVFTNPVLNGNVTGGDGVQTGTLSSDSTELASAETIFNAIALVDTGGSGNVSTAVTLDSGNMIVGNGTSTIRDANIVVSGNDITSIGDITSSGNISAVSLSLTENLNVSDGGTGVGTFTRYGLLYGDTTNFLKQVSVPVADRWLKSGANGIPQWASLPSSSGGNVTTSVTLTNDRLVVGNNNEDLTSTNVTLNSSNNITGVNEISATTVTAGTANLTNALDVDSGGTGLSNLDVGGVMLGSGANNVTVLAPPTTAGKVLTSGASFASDPTWEDPTGGNVNATSDFGIDNSVIIADGTGKNVNSSGRTITSTTISNGGSRIPTENAVYDHVTSRVPGDGVGQDAQWYDLGNPGIGTVYRNTYGKPIMVTIIVSSVDQGQFTTVYVGTTSSPNILVSYFRADGNNNGNNAIFTHSFIVPVNHYYSVTNNGTGTARNVLL